MSSLKNTTLGNLIEFQRGFDLPKNNLVSGKYPVISSNGIFGYHNQYKVKGPGVTIGRSGTVGYPQFIETDFFPHNTSLYIKDFKGNDPKYIFYLIKYLNLNTRKSGTGVPTMNRNDLHPLAIKAYFDISYQQIIANILSILDSKISLNNRINTELEEMAKTLYNYWFVQFDFPFDFAQGKPSDKGKPYKASGGKMVFNEVLKREIPKGWESGTLIDVANIVMGQSPPGESYNESGDGMVFFQGRTDFNTRFPLIRMFTTSPSRIANEGDILLSVRAPVGDINIANEKCCVGRGLAALNSKYNSNSYLFYLLLNLKPMFDIQNRTGTTFGAINRDTLQDLKIVKPPIEIQLMFQEIVGQYDTMILIRSRENQELIQLRDFLLPLLMNGQVRVK